MTDPTVAERNELAALPKAELHCHLEGIVDPEMLEELEGQGAPLPVSSAEFRRNYPVKDFPSFLAWAKAQDAFQGSILAYLPLLRIHLRRLAEQGVVYTELQFAPGELPADHGAAVRVMREFREKVRLLEGGSIQVEFLGSLARQAPAARVEFVTERLLRLHAEGLVSGVSIAGPEKGFTLERFAQPLARLRAAGLGITVHAGEWGAPESVWDALKNANPHRLAHAVSAFRDPRLLAELRARGIHLEFCPTSNLKTASIGALREHPLRAAVESGLKFSLNTDAPGAFGCSMAGEYGLAAGVFGLSPAQLRGVTAAALGARFQPQLRGPAYSGGQSPSAGVLSGHQTGSLRAGTDISPNTFQPGPWPLTRARDLQ